MKTLKYILLLVVTLLFLGSATSNISAQAKKTTTTSKTTTAKKDDIKSLKNKQTQLKGQINETGKQLTATQKSTKQSLQELERLNADIDYRDMLINRRSKEIEDINTQVEILNNNIKQLGKERDSLQHKYADMLYYAYMIKGQQNIFLYILSSKNFQEGIRRFQYLNNLAESCKEHSAAIAKTCEDIQQKRDKMKQLKEKTEELRTKQEQEKAFALIQKKKQDNLITSLRTREKELKQELKKQQAAADNLNRKIQDMIAKQAAAAAAKAAAKKQPTTTTKTNTTTNSKTTTTSNSSYTMTQEEKVIANGFAQNKGLLQWPVKGTITGKFGVQPHPVLKDITINNKGVYISAAPGSKATAVYDGTVSQCFSVPGGNNAVIVRHGNYLTVYANLTQIYVKNGDKIKKNTPIGKIHQETDNNQKTTLFFQIWQEKNLLNPQLWLRR